MLQKVVLITHCSKVQKYIRAKHVSDFCICGANNVAEYYGKKMKSCMGVLLRANLTGHGHLEVIPPISAAFGRYSSVPNRHAVRNKPAGGKIVSKSINVQTKIRP